MMEHTTITDMLRARAEEDPDAIAVVASGRPPLTYAGLRAQVTGTVEDLAAMGLARDSRIAQVLPDGAEAMVASLALASAATCIPLNPSFLLPEFDQYLRDVRPDALLAHADDEGPAVQVAAELGVPVIRLTPLPEQGAGSFAISGETGFAPAATRPPSPDDTALVMATSGTTAVPKRVVLTHLNVCLWGASVGRAYRLTSEDLCLTLGPTYHARTLLSHFFSTLAAGAGIACTGDFSAERFFDWLLEVRPTWYGAVPAMHLAILARAEEYAESIRDCRLRFIRSGAAKMSDDTRRELEDVFGAPVIEAYGMTETCITATAPFPPAPRRPGSVGVILGPHVAVMDEAGDLLPTGQRGEIVVRGPGVTPGYEDNPEANRAAFADGWFRTGDEGMIDADGYLYLTGRIKEMINRGGQKVAPAEVDEALRRHPDVREAVSFGVPHSRLGEEVAVAVVPRPGADLTPEQVRAFAAGQLAEFKVPRKVVIVSEIPVGAAGKAQRAELPLLLGLEDGPRGETEQPRDPVERAVAGAWQRALGAETVGLDDEFADLGGDSLGAVQLILEVERALDISLPSSLPLEAPTVRTMAREVRRLASGSPGGRPVLLSAGGAGTPIFLAHAADGDVFCYAELAGHLGDHRPVYGLSLPGLDGERATPDSIEALAAEYVDAIKRVQPDGRYQLAGWSGGGAVVYEIAQQLVAAGESVGLLAVIDAPAPGSGYHADRRRGGLSHLLRLAREVALAAAYHVHRRPGQRRNLARRFHRRTAHFGRLLMGHAPVVPRERGAGHGGPADMQERARVASEAGDTFRAAVAAYTPRPYDGPMTLFRARRQGITAADDPTMGWGTLASRLEIVPMPGEHGLLLRGRFGRVLAAHLRARLDN